MFHVLEANIITIKKNNIDSRSLAQRMHFLEDVFQIALVSVINHWCTTWTLTKRLEKKLDGNYTRMLRAILNKSWRQHPTRHQLYGHQPPITKSIQVRRARHAGHCWRSKDKLVSDILLWTPTYGQAKAGRPARTYIQQLWEDTGCNPEDLPEAMNDREKWREMVRDIRAGGTTWWWWHLFESPYILNMICKRIVCSKQFLNGSKIFCLHTIKWFQVFLSNTNSFIFTVLLRVQLNNHLYAHS